MADYKQYVNLDPSSKDQLKDVVKRRAGKEIWVKAKLNKKIAGVPVVFEIKSGKDNVIKSLDSTNLSAAQRKELAKLRKSTPGLENPGSSKRRIMTDKNGAAVVKFVLSDFGGDEFEIKAYLKAKKKNTELLSDKYIVWRRIYYQVSRFKDGPKGAGRTGTLPAIPNFDWSPVKKELKERMHNIELVDDSSKDLITRRCNVLEKDEDLKKSAREGYDNKREPVTLRTVLVNMIAYSKPKQLTTVTVSENDPITLTLAESLWKDESLPDKGDFVIDALWRHTSGSDTGWKALDKAHVEMVNHNKIKIHFDKIPKRHFLHFFRKAQVKIKVRLLKSSINGLSWYNTIWIAHENMHSGTRPLKEKLATTIHETGHFIGMVPAGQTTHYTGHGHKGGHCTTGLSATDKAKTEYWGLSGTCVMFGESATGRKNEFCAKCDPSVRKAKIVLDKMPAGW